jgi:hypothetical protein
MVLDPCDIMDVSLYGPAPVPQEVTSVYFGQAITSMRTLIKTYNPYIITRLATTSLNGGLLSFIHPTRPLPGNSVSSQVGTVDTWNYWTFYSWYSQAFLGVRGGTRWKVEFHSPYDLISAAFVNPSALGPPSASVMSDLGTYGATGWNLSFVRLLATMTVTAPLRLAYGVAQAAFQNFGRGELIEIDVPSLNPLRFTLGWSPSAYTFGSGSTPFVSGAGCETSGFVAGVPYTSFTANSTHIPISVFQSGSEDTSFAWFVCGPILYVDSNRAT